MGVVLEASKKGFDAGAATFSTVLFDEENLDPIYLFYTGASEVVGPHGWSSTSIGLAVSNDGLRFRKFTELNPILRSEQFNYKEAVTPVVFKAGGYFYMVFAGKPPGKRRRICIAYSEDPKGPWHFIKVLIKPKHLWEGRDIDLGPSAVKLTENEVLIYYSNVSRPPGLWTRLFIPRYLLRRVGILKMKVRSAKNIEVSRYKGNPLKHLNGPKGSWNESLFCPGYLRLRNAHYLLPSASTYSIGFPFKQYIGMITDSSPYFQRPESVRILIDGPKEKEQIIPGIKSEIALDTPCPIVKGNKIYLYFAVMDREYSIWKTALTIFPLDAE